MSVIYTIVGFKCTNSINMMNDTFVDEDQQDDYGNVSFVIEEKDGIRWSYKKIQVEGFAQEYVYLHMSIMSIDGDIEEVNLKPRFSTIAKEKKRMIKKYPQYLKRSEFGIHTLAHATF